MWYARVTSIPFFVPRSSEMNHLFHDAIARTQATTNEWCPAVNIRETDTAVTFAVELPGVKLEDLEVTATDGVLTIHGHRADEQKEGDEGRFHLVEQRSYGSFTRRFELPNEVDAAHIDAEITNGMLEVRIPKTALPLPTRIPIRTGADARNRVLPALGPVETRKDSAKKANGAKRLEPAGV